MKKIIDKMPETPTDIRFEDLSDEDKGQLKHRAVFVYLLDYLDYVTERNPKTADEICQGLIDAGFECNSKWVKRAMPDVGHGYANCASKSLHIIPIRKGPKRNHDYRYYIEHHPRKLAGTAK